MQPIGANQLADGELQIGSHLRQAVQTVHRPLLVHQPSVRSPRTGQQRQTEVIEAEVSAVTVVETLWPLLMLLSVSVAATIGWNARCTVKIRLRVKWKL